jgi:hypothetical protein
MSIRPDHSVSPRSSSTDVRPPLLYWPVLVAAVVVAAGFVATCLVMAWLLARPGGQATGPAPAVGAPVEERVAHEVLPPEEPPLSPPIDPGRTEKKLIPARPVPSLLVDALPGDAVGKKHEAVAKSTAVADPGLVSVGDALAAEKPAGTYGTQIEFIENPADAAQKALKERKLQFVLHISGNFEEARFT